jgi:hypothetical protein
MTPSPLERAHQGADLRQRQPLHHALEGLAEWHAERHLPPHRRPLARQGAAGALAHRAQRLGQRPARLHAHAQDVEQCGQVAADAPGALCGHACKPGVRREEAGRRRAEDYEQPESPGRQRRERQRSRSEQHPRGHLRRHGLANAEARGASGRLDAPAEVARHAGRPNPATGGRE